MDWQTLRQTYPHRWLIVEALDAYTEDNQRVIPRLELVGDFGSEWNAAWERYKVLHQADKHREYYILHTDRESLEIGVLDSFWRVVP